LYQIGLEERMLIQEFGDEYLEYRKHTEKLIPKPKKQNSAFFVL